MEEEKNMEYKKNFFLRIIWNSLWRQVKEETHSVSRNSQMGSFYLAHSSRRLWEPSVFFYCIALPNHNKYGLPQANGRCSVWRWEIG